MSAAQQRWSAFLAQIEQRHAQVRAESEQFGTAYTADDLAALSHHLMGVKSRLQDLEQSIESTWHAKVDDVFAAEGASGETRAAAFMQGRTLGHRRARYEPAIQVHNLPFEIGSRMEQWYVSSAEFEPAWVQAGRPREPL